MTMSLEEALSLPGTPLSQVADPATRALIEEVLALRDKVERIESGQHIADLGLSTIENGTLRVTDAAGTIRGGLGLQPDGKFGFGAANGPAPSRPNTPTVEPTQGGIKVTWNGDLFDGPPASDFTYVTVHASPVGASFIPGPSNRVGNLLGAGTLPVTGLPTDGSQYWVCLVAHNTSGVDSDPSFVAGPTTPSTYLAQAVVDGIIDTLALAANAVTEANMAPGSIGATEIQTGSVTSPKIAALAIIAGKIAANAVQAGTVDADAITGREIRALSLLAEHFTAGSVQADAIAAGAVTADKLEALLVLATTIIAGDENDWHLEMGDSDTPILYWNGTTTGFALSRDPDTGQSNIYLSGRVVFGNGSQIENDYLDLIEQPSTGFPVPRARQNRTWVQSEPTTTTIAPRWVSATQPGNTLLVSVLVVGTTSTPTITAPSGWSQVFTVTAGSLSRLSLYQLPNAPSHSMEAAWTASQASEWSMELIEYPGLLAAPLDKTATATGTGSTASTGTTVSTTQAVELEVACFAAPRAGKGNAPKTPGNGFTQILSADGATGLTTMVATRTVSSVGAASSTAVVPAGSLWLGGVATFKVAAAVSAPPAPAPQTVRLYTRPRGGASALHAVDATGRTYPVGRGPFCRAHLTKNIQVGQAVNLFAQGDWAPGTGDDPYGMVSISTTAGVFSSITIPLDGIYLIDFRCIYQTSSGGDANDVACFVTKGSADINVSVARDLRPYMVNGEGSPVQAMKMVALHASDVLYWGNWQSAGGTTLPTLFSVIYSMFTEIEVFYWGPLS